MQPTAITAAALATRFAATVIARTTAPRHGDFTRIQTEAVTTSRLLWDMRDDADELGCDVAEALSDLIMEWEIDFAKLRDGVARRRNAELLRDGVARYIASIGA